MIDPAFNATDVGVAIVLLISALLAFARGLIHELLSVAGWVGAIFAAIYGFPLVKPYVEQLIPQPLAAALTTGVLIFLVSLVFFSFLTRAIAGRIRESALNFPDRVLGFLFGILRGAVLISLAYIGVEWMLPPPEQPPWLRQAFILPYIEQGAVLIKELVPDGTAERLGEKAGKALDREEGLGHIQIPGLANPSEVGR